MRQGTTFRLQNNLAVVRPIFGMAHMAHHNTSMLYHKATTRWGGVMVFADRLFGFGAIAIGILSSLLIVMAMI